MANLSNINGKFVVEQTTGYVGVGTTDPNYPIEVLNASAEIALNASGGSIYRLKSDSTDFFRINKNGVGDRLVIDDAGNVGIGTPSPDNILTLQAAAGSMHQRFKEVGTTIGFIGGANGIISSHNGKFAVRAEAGLVLSSQGNAADVVISSGNATFS